MLRCCAFQQNLLYINDRSLPRKGKGVLVSVVVTAKGLQGLRRTGILITLCPCTDVLAHRDRTYCVRVVIPRIAIIPIIGSNGIRQSAVMRDKEGNDQLSLSLRYRSTTPCVLNNRVRMTLHCVEPVYSSTVVTSVTCFNPFTVASFYVTSVLPTLYSSLEPLSVPQSCSKLWTRAICWPSCSITLMCNQKQ